MLRKRRERRERRGRGRDSESGRSAEEEEGSGFEGSQGMPLEREIMRWRYLARVSWYSKWFMRMIHIRRLRSERRPLRLESSCWTTSTLASLGLGISSALYSVILRL